MVGQNLRLDPSLQLPTAIGEVSAPAPRWGAIGTALYINYVPCLIERKSVPELATEVNIAFLTRGTSFQLIALWLDKSPLYDAPRKRNTIPSTK